METCPNCKTAAVVAHCPNATCTWKRCPICRGYGSLDRMHPYVTPVSVEVLYEMAAIADEVRSPARPVFGG